MKKGTLLLISSILWLTISLYGQCPDRYTLLKRITDLRDSLTISDKEQLSILLPFADSLNACGDKYDTIHAFLYKRLGALYYNEADYSNSLLYYRQFVNMLAESPYKSGAATKYLMGGYYWLSVIYDSMGMENEKWKALDDCIDIAEKIN